MSAELGVTNYKDLVNSNKLHLLKDKIHYICLNFAKMASQEAVENREADGFETYSEQYGLDLMYLKEICKNAQDLINECNDTMFLISEEAMLNRLRTY